MNTSMVTRKLNNLEQKEQIREISLSNGANLTSVKCPVSVIHSVCVHEMHADLHFEAKQIQFAPELHGITICC